MMKSIRLFVLTAVAISSAFLAGCNSDSSGDEGGDRNHYTITFEGAKLASESGAYTNILWGKERAEGKEGEPEVFEGAVYSEEGADFSSYYMNNGQYDMWAGFAISSGNDKGAGMLEKQFDAYVAQATKFAVAYMQFKYDGAPEDLAQPEITFSQPTIVHSAQMAVNTYIYNDISSKVPETEDVYYKVVFEGHRNDGTKAGNFVEVMLVEKGKPITDWKTVNLEPLGEVDRITFSFDTNYKNVYGPLIPSYFCIDNIRASERR